MAFAVTTTETDPSKIIWRDETLPYSTQYGDIYFSLENGLEESRYVFIQQNGLPERWQHARCHSFTIAETGFGTGLNFLALWQTWHQWRTHNPNAIAQHIHYISVEKHPLSFSDLVRALRCWPELAAFSQTLQDAYPPQPLTGHFRFDFGSISLSLILADATAGLEQLCKHPIDDPANLPALQQAQMGSRGICVDAWMLDGFAPSKNPDMWQAGLFACMAKLSAPGSTFATFTAAGEVRRRLNAAGFRVRKVKGYGNKREMLCGEFEGHDLNKQHEQSTAQTWQARALPKKHPGYWYLQPHSACQPSVTHVAVIGGGLSGCHTAFALAKRGIRVTLYEQASALASAASGNEQGVVYTRPSPHENALNRFNTAAQLFADHFYQINGLYERCGEQCGVLHLPTDKKQAILFEQYAGQFQPDSQHVAWLNSKQASELSGVDIDSSALYLQNAGWLDPRKLCRALAEHPLITIKLDSPASPVQRQDNKWQISPLSGQAEDLYDAMVICSANDALTQPLTAHLPLKAVRGQVSHLPATVASQQLKKVICGAGYIAPHYGGQHCAGATFTLHNQCSMLDPQDHRKNLSTLQSMLPRLVDTSAWAAKSDSLEGKVGFRCTTPDYLPLAGPVADEHAFLLQFAPLRQSALDPVLSPGHYHTGLYCNLGLGSRGLAYAPLTAELVASLIHGDPLPLSRDLYLHLHPARFLVRSLKRKQI